jgi:hypothetical protein
MGGSGYRIYSLPLSERLQLTWHCLWSVERDAR